MLTEDLPYTRLRRSYNQSTGRHWTSSRIAPDGFQAESSFRLLRNPAANTMLLYECQVGARNLISKDPNCENLIPLGPVGYIYSTPFVGRSPNFQYIDIEPLT